MKRSVLSLFFSAMLLASIHPLGSFAEEKPQEYNCRKDKTETIEYVERYNDSDVQTKIPVGSWKYTITIENNKGVGPFGYRFRYDKNVVEPMVYADGKPVVVKNSKWKGVIGYSVDINKGICGIGGMSTENNYINGDIYFGYYSNDLRNKSGLYIYKPKLISSKTTCKFV